jgi:hypothetical protein
MSEGVAYGGHAPAPSRSQPAYGEGRLSFEAPPKSQEHLDAGTELALAFVIFVPVLAVYGAVGYGVYRAVSALM